MSEGANYRTAAEQVEARAAAEREQVARHVLWHSGDARGQEPGSFTSKLLDAWVRADGANDLRLRGAFPLLGEAIQISRTLGSDALAEWGGIS